MRENKLGGEPEFQASAHEGGDKMGGDGKKIANSKFGKFLRKTALGLAGAAVAMGAGEMAHGQPRAGAGEKPTATRNPEQAETGKEDLNQLNQEVDRLLKDTEDFLKQCEETPDKNINKENLDKLRIKKEGFDNQKITLDLKLERAKFNSEQNDPLAASKIRRIVIKLDSIRSVLNRITSKLHTMANRDLIIK